MHARCCQTKTGRLQTREELELGPVAATTMTITKQGVDMPSWMFKEEPNREETKNRASKKKPAQPKKKDNRATKDVQEGTREGTCVVGPVLMRAQAKMSDKIHPLKHKEGMSNVDKSTIDHLQKKDSTLKKCIDGVGNRLSERTML